MSSAAKDLVVEPKPTGSQFPALLLLPLSDSFAQPRKIRLNGVRIKIGRQTNIHTVPAEHNGFFDSKVLSRQHAEVWEDGGRMFIKDTKSVNGTYLNGERLSGEGLESAPFVLKTGDVLDIGRDVSASGDVDDTIVFYKVSARVVCDFGTEAANH